MYNLKAIYMLVCLDLHRYILLHTYMHYHVYFIFSYSLRQSPVYCWLPFWPKIKKKYINETGNNILQSYHWQKNHQAGRVSLHKQSGWHPVYKMYKHLLAIIINYKL